MTNDPHFAAMVKVLDIISNSNDLAAALELKMNGDPQEEYTLDALELAVIIAQLRTSATLAKNLFEENQSINDKVIKILSNLNTKKN